MPLLRLFWRCVFDDRELRRMRKSARLQWQMSIRGLADGTDDIMDLGAGNVHSANEWLQ